MKIHIEIIIPLNRTDLYLTQYHYKHCHYVRIATINFQIDGSLLFTYEIYGRQSNILFILQHLRTDECP